MTASVHIRVRDFSHLSAEVLAQLRAALVDELEAKAAESDDHDARARLLTGHTDVDSLLERELAEMGASRARDAMTEIEDALARMDRGTYGVCEACGAPVRAERLEAIPHARHCVRCSGTRPERSR
jgi:DnaK suppressor protein